MHTSHSSVVCYKWLVSERFLQVLGKSGRKCLITLTGGGDPFLIPNIIEFSHEITKEHFLAFNTSLTIPKVRLFANEIDPQWVHYIYASAHFEKLFSGKLIDRFIENMLLSGRPEKRVISTKLVTLYVAA